MIDIHVFLLAFAGTLPEPPIKVQVWHCPEPEPEPEPEPYVWFRSKLGSEGSETGLWPV